MMRKAFTLIEVNLAMLIMAGGILSIVGLYAFGFRESSQSREDVASAALADAVVSPLVLAISQTNLKWSVFRNIGSFPNDDGWGAYLSGNGTPVSNPDAQAKSAFGSAMSAYKGAVKGTSLNIEEKFPNTASADLLCGLVVMHEPDSPIVGIGFRATKSPGQLLAMPLYYTEVRFQGLGNE